MPDYAARIANLKTEQAKLAQRQSELAAQRRGEIGRLAEKLGVLENGRRRAGRYVPRTEVCDGE